MLKTLSARLLTVIVGWTLRGGSAAGGSIAAPDAGGFAMPLVFGLTLRSGFVQLGSDSVCPRFENR